MPRLSLFALAATVATWSSAPADVPGADGAVNASGLAPVVIAVPPAEPAPSRSVSTPASRDVRALITAAHGAAPALCAYAARAIGGWGNGLDAPATLLPPIGDRHSRRDPLPAADVQFLLQALGDSDPCPRELAVRLLAQEDDDAVTTGLLERLAAADSGTRLVASLGLGIRESARAVEPLTRAARDRVTGVRANALWALGRIGDGRALRPALSALSDDVPLVRETAAGTLGHLDSAAAVPALLRALKDDAVPAVRRTAAWALAELGARSAADGLAAALRADKAAEVREMAAWALGEIEASGATASLLAAARGDADADVRETAVWALGELEDAGAADALGQVVASDKEAAVRATAAWALGQMELSSAPRGLLTALADPAADVRLRAAWAVSQIEDPAALPAVRAALRREQDAEVRRAQVRALIMTGERTEELTRLLESPDPEIRQAAVRGLAGQRGVDPWPWPAPRPRPFPR